MQQLRMNIQSYIKLLRIKHYIKNILVVIPCFFAGGLFDGMHIKKLCLGFVAFSLISSAVYIFNDIMDIEKDRNHPIKMKRPLASGNISKRTAWLTVIILLLFVVCLSLIIHDYKSFLCLMTYFVLNVLYSLGMKNKPIIDVTILASGFVLRILYGGLVTKVIISKWLYLVVVTGSLYMGLGKRRNELVSHTDTREVLQYYNESFLSKNMYVCAALVNVFYALWTIEMPNPQMIYTVPFFIILSMCYSLDVEGNSDGDPVEVIIHNKTLAGLIMLYALFIFVFLYGKGTIIYWR